MRLPAEAYLHEIADADAASDDDLCRLARLGQWCPEGSTAQPGAAYRDLPIFTDAQWLRARVETSALTGRPFREELEQERDRILGERLTGRVVHLDEIALRVRTVQAMTRHLVAYQQGRPVRDAWRKCPTDEKAWDRFVDWANAALRDVHVRVSLAHLPNGVMPTTAYTVAVLQLINDLSEGEVFRYCANETCRRPFIHQRGRARYADQGTRHSTGVLYCSRSCARAQAERERRRRLRPEREES